MARNKIIHNKGLNDLGTPNLGDGNTLQYGELAINYSNNSPKIYIRKQDDTIAVFEGDVEYTLVQGTPGDGIAAEYHLEKNNVQVGPSINIPKDQFLKSVSYDDTTKQLVFVFTTSTGDTTTNISIADLIDTYEAGDGITISGHTISTSNSVVQGINVNGVDATVDGKKATVSINGSHIDIGSDITDRGITANTKVNDALSALNDKINESLTGVTSGNGITISAKSESGQTISAKVINENGLSVDDEGIKIGLASENVAGTLKSCTISSFSALSNESLVKASLNDGVLAIQVSNTIDGGEY